jgi:hypothetical protein
MTAALKARLDDVCQLKDSGPDVQHLVNEIKALTALLGCAAPWPVRDRKR